MWVLALNDDCKYLDLCRETLLLKFGDWPLPITGGQPGRCTKVRPNLPSAVGSEGNEIIFKNLIQIFKNDFNESWGQNSTPALR
jgi:hypothetical protein